jgi:cobalamin biosynthesis protein CobC
VSGMAIAIGTQALSDAGWAAAERERLRAQAARLDDVLAGAGLTVAGGTALFRLVRHARAGEIHDALARQHIWVRRFDWAPDLLRFGLPPDDVARERLAVALTTV